MGPDYVENQMKNTKFPDLPFQCILLFFSKGIIFHLLKLHSLL